MPISEEEIKDRVTYHAPSESGIGRHGSLSAVIADAMRVVNGICPDGREKSLAFTHLEDAKFWASAAVARNPETR